MNFTICKYATLWFVAPQTIATSTQGSWDIAGEQFCTSCIFARQRCTKIDVCNVTAHSMKLLWDWGTGQRPVRAWGVETLHVPGIIVNTLQIVANLKNNYKRNIRHPKYKFRHPKYKFRYPKYMFRHPKYKFRHPKYKFRHPKYKFRHPKCKFSHQT